MWYFLIQQNTLDRARYQALQKRATLTEVELFNEPYENWYLFSVEKDNFTAFVDYLDRDGISYELASERPTRDEMLANMK